MIKPECFIVYEVLSKKVKIFDINKKIVPCIVTFI